MDAWVKERGIILIGVDLDESPMACRRLLEVLAEAFRHNQNPDTAPVRCGHGRKVNSRSIEGLKVEWRLERR
jgi:hypothetical protein